MIRFHIRRTGHVVSTAYTSSATYDIIWPTKNRRRIKSGVPWHGERPGPKRDTQMVGSRWWSGQDRTPNQGKDWGDYSRRLRRMEQELDGLKYQSVFDQMIEPLQIFSAGFFTISRGSGDDVTVEQLATILSLEHLGPPHGEQ